MAVVPSHDSAERSAYKLAVARLEAACGGLEIARDALAQCPVLVNGVSAPRRPGTIHVDRLLSEVVDTLGETRVLRLHANEKLAS